jgi:hypothetical protein
VHPSVAAHHWLSLAHALLLLLLLLPGEGLEAGGASRTAKPLSSMSNAKDVLRFQRLANGTITVTDVQNNTAQVTDKAIMLPRANVFPVNRVLLNGEA